jgi:hypothetical protein
MMRLALVVLCLLASCSRAGSRRSGPTIDATTQESFAQSLRIMVEGMSEEQRREIGKVIVVNAKQLLAMAAQLPATPR